MGGASIISPWRIDLDKALRFTADLAQSVNAGAGRGIIGLAGLQGDIRRAATERVIDLGERVGILSRQQAATARANEPWLRHMTPGPFGPAQTSQELTQSLPKATQRGIAYQPKTVAGHYARTIGEFAPSMLAPGTVAAKTATVVGPAVASEAAGQAARGTPREGAARFAGALAGGGLTNALLRSAGVPMLRTEAQIPDDIGYRPYTRVDRAFDTIEDAFGRGAVEYSSSKRLQAFNEAVKDGKSEGRMQIRLDLDGHGYEPHFHIQTRPIEGPTIDLTPNHHNPFRKE